MFGKKPPTIAPSREMLRAQEKQTRAIKDQTRQIQKQTRLMQKQARSMGSGAGGQGGAEERSLLGDVGKMLGAVGGAVAETIAELQEDIRSHRQLTDQQKALIAKGQVGHFGEGDAADALENEPSYLPPGGPANPLTHSSVWSTLTAPGTPKVQLDSYFHTTDTEDLATYLTALKAEEKYPFTATMVAIGLRNDDKGATHLAAFRRALAENPNLYGIVGYGPRHLVEDTEKLDDTLTTLLNEEEKILALGPIGLDAVYAPHTMPQQIAQFKQQLEIAADFELPVYLMNRNATQQTKQAIAEANVTLPGIVYTKPLRTEEEIAMMQELNAHVLLRAELTWEEEGTYREAIAKKIPRNRWLLASGSGLVAAHSRRGQTNVPDTLREVLKTLQQLITTGSALPEDILTDINTNSHRLFVR